MNEPKKQKSPKIEINDLESNHFKIDEQRPKPSKLKVALFWICGIESSLKEGYDPDAKIEHEIDTSIDQDPFWSNVCDLNAVIAIAISGFTVAFYNKYE